MDAAIQLLSWSHVLQGNILFCGFRNGVISTIDLRKPAPKESGMHHRADSAVNGGNSGYQYKSKGINPNVKNQHFGVAHANVRPLPRLFIVFRVSFKFCSKGHSFYLSRKLS